MDEIGQSEFVSRLISEIGRLAVEVDRLERKVISQKIAHRLSLVTEALG